MRRTLHQVNGLISLAGAYDADAVSVQYLVQDFSGDDTGARYGPLSTFVEREALGPEDADAVADSFAEARARADRAGLELRLPAVVSEAASAVSVAMERPHAAQAVRGCCDWPWDASYVTWRGDVVPCCVIATPERLTAGDVLRSDFPSLWNGDVYRSLREGLLSGDPHPPCAACSMYRGVF